MNHDQPEERRQSSAAEKTRFYEPQLTIGMNPSSTDIAPTLISPEEPCTVTGTTDGVRVTWELTGDYQGQTQPDQNGNWSFTIQHTHLEEFDVTYTLLCYAYDANDIPANSENDPRYVRKITT